MKTTTKRLPRFLPALLLATLLVGGGTPLAAPGVSLDDAVNQARQRYPGRVLSAETQRRNGEERHRIRILTDQGEVKRLNIDSGSRRERRRDRRD